METDNGPATTAGLLRLGRWMLLGLVPVVIPLLSCDLTTSPEDDEPVETQGTMYSTVIIQETDPDIPTDPVNGAVVSTSLDEHTAITNAGSRFHLTTETRLSSGCEPYTITITAEGLPQYSQAGSWGRNPVDQVFILSTGDPRDVGTC